MTKQKTFKSLLKLEIKDAAFYSATAIVTQLGNLLVIPLFWKVLTPTDYGIIAVVEIIGVFLAVVLGLSLEQSVARFFYEWPENERAQRLGAIWVVNWGSSIVLGLLVTPILFFVSPYLFPEVKFFPFLFMGLISTVFTSLSVMVQTTIRIKRLPVQFAVYRISTFLIQIGLCIYFVLSAKAGLYGYFTAIIISSILNAAISALVMSRHARPCFQDADLKKSLMYSLPVIPATLLGSANIILDRLLLNQFCTLETLGIYSIAFKFASVVTVVHATLKMSYQPFFMKNIYHENGEDIIYRMTGVYIFPLFLAGLVVSIFSEKLILIFNQPSYFRVINFVPYMVAIALISSLNIYYANGISLSKKTHLMIIPAAVQVILMLVAGYMLIPSFQVYGVIAAKILSFACFLVILVMISNRVYRFRYNWACLVKFISLMLLGIVLDQSLKTNSLTLNIMISFVITLVFLITTYYILKDQVKTTEAMNT